VFINIWDIATTRGFPDAARGLLYSVQTSSGLHPASYTVGIRGNLPSGVKRPWREAGHSLPSTVAVTLPFTVSRIKQYE
jgi:hypothetical protein